MVPSTIRVDVASDGSQANYGATQPALSDDGRYVAFTSFATNLTQDPVYYEFSHIFRRDTQSGTTSLVSVKNSGTWPMGPSSYPAISGDGRYVVFQSDADNLISGDTNGVTDVFVRDVTAATTTRVSVASDGTQANGASSHPAISGDGRFVVFESNASNLFSGDSNAKSDVFIRDRQTGTTKMVSLSTDGVQGNDNSTGASVSDDGRYVAFVSLASNLVPGDGYGSSDAFVYNRQAQTITKIGRDATEVALSSDGRYVAFTSAGRDLVPNDTNEAADIFRFDRQGASTNHWLDEYRGFEQVREADSQGNYTDHWFYTTGFQGGKDADKLTGKEYKVEWRDSSNNLLQQRITSWNWAYCCVYGSGPYQNSQVSWWVYRDQEDIVTGSKTARTRYTYDLPSTSPVNTGYGNVIRENRDGDADPAVTADDSTVFYGYNRNTPANILDTVNSQKTYAGSWTAEPGSEYLKTETYSFYDGNNADGQLGTAPTKGQLTRLKRAITLGTTYANTYNTFDAFGNKLSEQDPNTNTCSWTFDATYHNLPITETCGALQESATWDFGSGKMLSWTDANNQTTSYEYDPFKRQTKTIRPGGDSSGSPTVCYRYNAWGTIGQQNLETVTKLSGIADTCAGTEPADTLWSKQYFDGLGRVVQVQSKGETEGGTTYTILDKTTDYSNRGLVDKEYVPQKLVSNTLNGYKTPDGSWKYTSYAYDGLGRVTAQTGPDTTTVSHSYSNWQDIVTNPRGIQKNFTYDAFKRLAMVEEFNDSVPPTVYATTQYTYDVLGNLLHVQDAAGNHTTMAYDALSRKTGMSDPDMGPWSYVYDLNGNLTGQTDAKIQTITFTYDSHNRPTQKCTPNCSGTVLATYTYDSTMGGNFGKGRKTGMTDASGSAAYTYDSRGRLVQEVKTVDGVPYTTGYTYDGADRATGVTYPTGEAVAQTYNGRGLPATLGHGTTPDLVTSAAYNQFGLPTSLGYNNGVITSYQYWGLEYNGGSATSYGRLYSIRAVNGSSTVLQDVTHSWDANGNLNSRTNTVGTSEPENFDYDFLDRLKEATGTYTESYAYNTIGNITSKNLAAYTYGSSKPHAVTAVGSTNYAYDANGNMTTRAGQVLTWDVENRPTTIVSPTNGLVAHWKFNEGTGTAGADGSGNGNSGTLVNGPAWVDGLHSKALQFDGTNDYVNVANDGTLTTTSAFTLSAWVKWSGGTGSVINKDSQSSGNREYFLDVASDGTVHLGVFASGTDPSYEYRNSNVTLSTGVWYHVVGVYNGGASPSLDVYVNGTLQNGTLGGNLGYIPASIYNSTQVVQIGAQALGPWPYFFSGNLDDVRLYNRALSGDEVQTVNSGGTSTFVYDGDGNRVKKIEGGQTTVYVNKYYEKNTTSSVETSYYYLGGKLVGLKKGTTLEYMHQDHLGGTAVTTDSVGDVKSTLKYLPYGSTRSSSGLLDTDKKFTGQRLDGTGLYYYNARYYDPSIGRFISPDTVVPAGADSSVPFMALTVSYANPGFLGQLNQGGDASRNSFVFDPQALNRYTYTRNSPLVYTDESGHCPWCGVVGGFVGFGAYALTHRANFSWSDATVWTAAGVVTGLTLGMGVQWVVGTLGGEVAAAASTAAEANAQRGVSGFSRAAEFGIRSYSQMSKLTRGTGLKAHHLIERRFARVLGVREGDMPSIALTAKEHDEFTRAWLNQIGRSNMRSPLKTDTATPEDIWRAAQVIYQDHSDLLEVLRGFLGIR